MRPFEGFHRKAIVIVPTDEEFKTRIEKRTKDEGKDIPDIAVYEMKGISIVIGLCVDLNLHKNKMAQIVYLWAKASFGFASSRLV